MTDQELSGQPPDTPTARLTEAACCTTPARSRLPGPRPDSRALPTEPVQGHERRLVPVRCPHCHKLAAEAGPGSQLRVKCVRCGRMFEWLREPIWPAG